MKELKENILDYEKDSNVDESMLDIEWLEQPKIAMKYGKNWARKKRIVAQLEEQVKLKRSELINKALKFPDKYLGKGIKPNLQPVEAFYRTHPDYIALKEELIEAQYELDIAEIAKSEMGYTRKTELENLVKLHGQNYFAGPSLVENISKRRRDREITRKESNMKIRITRRK